MLFADILIGQNFMDDEAQVALRCDANIPISDERSAQHLSSLLQFYVEEIHAGRDIPEVAGPS